MSGSIRDCSGEGGSEMLHRSVWQFGSFASVKCLGQNFASQEFCLVAAMGRQSGSAVGHVCSQGEAVSSSRVGPSLLEAKVGSYVAVVVLNGYAAAKVLPSVVLEPFASQAMSGKVRRLIVCNSCSHVL